MSLQQFENALRQLKVETATAQSRREVLTSIKELEQTGDINAFTANSWRAVIDWLVSIDLNELSAKCFFQDLTQDHKLRRAVGALGRKD